LSAPEPQNRALRTLALACATVFGTGYAPVASGTFGSAAGLVVWYLVPRSLVAQSLAIVIVFVIGSWSGSVAEEYYGRLDPGQVVIDEVAGMLMTLFLVPAGWVWAIVGFLLFRLSDIVKPYPANRLERLPGGVGIMADDVMAGVYANVALRSCMWLFGRLSVS
jgi:phosphatidylglycerophosphatase A